MKRILIIEDEPDVAETIKMFLEKKGYAVEYEVDAMEGVGKLKDFDLLLLDLIMPKVSGRAVLKEMKWVSPLEGKAPDQLEAVPSDLSTR